MSSLHFEWYVTLFLSCFFNPYNHINSLYFVMHDGSFLLRWKSLLPTIFHFQIFNPTFKCHTLCNIIINLFHIPFGGKRFNATRLFVKINTSYLTISFFSSSNNGQCIWLRLFRIHITLLIFAWFLWHFTCGWMIERQIFLHKISEALQNLLKAPSKFIFIFVNTSAVIWSERLTILLHWKRVICSVITSPGIMTVNFVDKLIKPSMIYWIHIMAINFILQDESAT